MHNEIAEIIRRLEKLEKAVFEENAAATSAPIVSTINLDFSINERAFIKKYSSGFNGQKYFALIVAYITAGKEATSVDLLQIKAIWKSCSGVIGVPYASIFSTRAKESGWVDSPKDARGSYVLGKHWKDIFN